METLVMESPSRCLAVSAIAALVLESPSRFLQSASSRLWSLRAQIDFCSQRYRGVGSGYTKSIWQSALSRFWSWRAQDDFAISVVEALVLESPSRFCIQRNRGFGPGYTKSIRQSALSRVWSWLVQVDFGSQRYRGFGHQ